MSNTINKGDELLIDTASGKFTGKVQDVNLTKKEVLVQRSYSKDVTTSVWVPFSDIKGIKRAS